MSKPPSVRRPVSLVALLVLLGGWLVLAPTQVGGTTTYVIVDGGSMLPGYTEGDLVVTRRVDGYAVGDVAAYLHPDLGPVIHRVVAHEGSRYVLQGDANGWLDDYQPAPADMLGRAWVHLPAVGGLLEKSRSGAVLVALCIVMGVLVMSLVATDRSELRSSRRRRGRRRAVPRPVRRADRPARGAAPDVVRAFAVVLLTSLVLGGVAFTRPALVPAPDRPGHTHTGTFGYSADAPSGLYDTDRVRTGQPVFRRLTDTLTVHFDYRLATRHATDGVEGSYRLQARISDPTNGWSRTLPLGEESAFTDGRFSATAPLDLAEVQRVITAMEERTGLHPDRYALTVAARVEVQGEVGQQPLEETFSPDLGFWLDAMLLQLQASGGDAGSEGDVLRPTQAGGTTGAPDHANTVPVLGLDLPVTTARLVAVVGILLSSIGLAVTTVPLVRALGGDHAGRIQARYRHLLVTIDGPPPADRAPVHVSTVEDLVKLAHATGRTILHRQGDDGDDYYIHEPDVLYHHRVPRQGSGSWTAPEQRSLPV